jgi:hypothetical protein
MMTMLKKQQKKKKKRNFTLDKKTIAETSLRNKTLAPILSDDNVKSPTVATKHSSSRHLR